MRALLSLMLAAAALCAHADENDWRVPFIATPGDVVERMLELAVTGPRDLVADLGSGDGRIVIAAARKYGARGLGIELDERLAEASRKNAEAAGVAERITIVTGDVPDMAPTQINLAAACGIVDLPTIEEPLDDVVIYASIQDIDGPSKILAQAGPCLFRNASFGGFAENDLAHDDPTGDAPEWVGVGLRAALSSYMRGTGVAADVRQWFGRPVPRPKVPRAWVARVLEETPVQDDPTAERRFVWIGGAPVNESYGHDRSRVILPTQTEDVEVRLSSAKAGWLLDLIRFATPTREKRGEGYPSLREVREAYPLSGPRGFDALARSAPWQQARTAGLLLV